MNFWTNCIFSRKIAAMFFSFKFLVLSIFSHKLDAGVSITLSNPVTPAPVSSSNVASVPASILSILDTMGLPLALLPTLLAVYRDVRDTYKLLVVQGYAVSWSSLLTLRLRSAWPGTSVTVASMDQLVAQTLTSAGHSQIVCKTVTRPGPVIPGHLVDLQMVTDLQDHVDRWDRHPLTAWKNWRSQLGLSARQFVSLSQFLCPASSSDLINWDDIMWQADLCDVWSRLSLSSSSSEGQDIINNNKHWRIVNKKKEDETVSFNKIGRWWRKVRNVSRGKKILSRRPRFVSSNPRLFWSNEKIELLKQAKLTAFDIWFVKKNRKYSSFKTLIVREFQRLLSPDSGSLTTGQILGKLAQIQRSDKFRVSRREDREWDKLVMEYHEFLMNEDDIETIEFVEESTEDVPVDVHEDGHPDYNLDADVIEFIRDKEGGKKMASNVWSSGALLVLLRARDSAQRRREKWEKWAIAKYGSLQSAYSNPRLKVPKLEELLVEEWSQLRPNQSGLSAWTLNGYLKKFDALKKQLIEEQEEAKRLKDLRMIPPVIYTYHPNTDIPVYKLEQLNEYSKLAANVKMLVSTRQRAFTSQNSNLRYLDLWSEQWMLETGEKVEGWRLQQRLYNLQMSSSVRNKLKKFMIIKENDANVPEEKLELDPNGFEYEAPSIVPRDSMFPRVPDTISEVLIRRKQDDMEDPGDLIGYDEENFVEVLGVGRLGLPVAIAVNELIEEEGIQYKPKMNYMKEDNSDVNVIQSSFQRNKFYSYPSENGSKRFSNFNNFQFHLQLRKMSNDPDAQESSSTFGQKMASYHFCQSLVKDCLTVALAQSSSSSLQ